MGAASRRSAVADISSFQTCCESQAELKQHRFEEKEEGILLALVTYFLSHWLASKEKGLLVTFGISCFRHEASPRL